MSSTFFYSIDMKKYTLLCCLLVVGDFVWGAKPKICWEAESARSVEPPMKVSSFEGASATCLEIPEGAGNPPKVMAGKAVYEVDLPAAGSYVLWCRVRWNGECSNSFTVSVDGKTPFLFGEDATYRQWHWVRYPISRTSKPLRLEAGRHTIEIRNREDGIWLDQILLSADRRFVPVDKEKVTK